MAQPGCFSDMHGPLGGPAWGAAEKWKFPSSICKCCLGKVQDTQARLLTTELEAACKPVGSFSLALESGRPASCNAIRKVHGLTTWLFPDEDLRVWHKQIDI